VAPRHKYRWYRSYVLGALTIVYTLNLLDGGTVSLLLRPIQNDLRLSDSQLGVLTGIAFGLFYATLGVPIARWADRGDRSIIISVASGVWGITTMVCSLATNFWQLFLARITAGVGESGCLPPAYSLLGDYFPLASERTRAMAIFMLANPLAALIGFIAAGWLNEQYGWRATFLIMGMPALLIAVIVRLTIRETRTRWPPRYEPKQYRSRLCDVLGVIWRQSSARNLAFAIILLWTMGNGMGPWYAAFMMRSHGMNTGELGVWFGLIFGIAGIIGVLLGGYLGSVFFSGNERAQMRLSAVSIAMLLPCFMLFLLSPDKTAALIALFVLQLVFSIYSGPTFALMQRLVADDIRATTLALVMFFANLIGLGLGPQIVGTLSDLLKPALGGDSLRYAMLILSGVGVWAAICFWSVGRTVKADLAEQDRDAAPCPVAARSL
jgi:predicted MFS family arabinose efflux permease